MVESDLQLDRGLARDMPRCWPAFFERFGRLTKVQREAIPPILAGQDLLVGAPTASGKTEAACAPLLERHLAGPEQRTILYLCPTRALVNDLYGRLTGPCGRLGAKVIRRTGDHPTRIDKTVDILITTPESFDSLLCRGRQSDIAHVLAWVGAVVLDEIHVLFGTPRGEQIRWLLERLRRLRKQAATKQWSTDDAVQVVALSATVVDAEAVCRGFLRGGRSIAVGGARPIESVRGHANQLTTEDALATYVHTLSRAEKILVFCNSRLRVDKLSAELRHSLAKSNYEVYAHHGSLSQRIREAAETAARTASKIVLVATSTLELGIDIGDIDLVVLDSPAPDMPSLLQRIGRGNRRTTITRVMTCSGALEETIIHSAMLEGARDGWIGPAEHGPSFAVIRQQLASYIFQAPRRARQLRTLESLLDSVAPEAVGGKVLAHMIAEGELIQDRDGIRLGNDWLVRAKDGRIHGNIESLPGETVIDAADGAAIASNVRIKRGSRIQIGGEFLEVKRWRDRKIEVQRITDSGKEIGEWGYTSRSWFRGAGQPQAVRRYLGFSENEWPNISDGATMKVFHFGGARRRAVIELIMENVAEAVTGFNVNEWYFSFLSGQEVRKIMQHVGHGILKISISDRLGSLERTLARPNANKSLPLDVRVREVTAWLQIDREVEQLHASVWKEVTDPAIKAVLLALA